MSEQNENTSGEQGSEGTRGRGRSRRSEKTEPKGPVLVSNNRGGPYTTGAATRRQNAPRNAAADPKLAYDVRYVRVLPGLQLVPREDYELIKGNQGFERRVASGEIELVGGFDDAEWQEDWGSLKVKRRQAMVEDSAHVETLRAILEIEEDDRVYQALRDQIEACTSGENDKQAVRRAQRAHNRGGRRPRGLN